MTDFCLGKSNRLHLFHKGYIVIGFGRMCKSFLGEGREDIKDFGQRMGHVLRCIISWKDLICPGERNSKSGAYGIKGQG